MNKLKPDLYQHLSDAPDRSRILQDILKENGTLNSQFIVTEVARHPVALHLSCKTTQRLAVTACSNAKKVLNVR